MKLTKEMVDEKVKQMMDYSRDNFGLPNGDDFLELAKVLADSEELAQTAFLHFIMVCVAQPEFTAKYLAGAKAAPDKKSLALSVQKHGGFRSFLDAVYLGYVLGKSIAEVELLENIHTNNNENTIQ